MEVKAKYSISKREKEVLTYISKGYSSQAIADHFYLSVYTIETHRKSILQKFQASNIAHAVAFAFRKKILK